jgi:predicted acyl esterase
MSVQSIWHNGVASQPPADYCPKPNYHGMIMQRDVMVPMRDGVHLCIDIFRPETDEKLPALLAIAPYNKELLSLEYAAAVPPQPAWSALWGGSVEAGDTEFLIARGYIHVIGTSRSSGKSEGGGSPAWDYYDLIEWIAVQPWCDGQIGMIGISAYGAAQLQAAALQPPHLKAIFPYDPGPAYREFRDRNPGGIIHSFPLTIDAGSVSHGSQQQPGVLSPENQKSWDEAMANNDIVMYHNLYNILTMKGQKSNILYNTLLRPYDTHEAVLKAEDMFERIKIPAYVGTGWYSQSYKSHFQGAQNWYSGIRTAKKLMFTGMSHLDRPFRAFHDEIIKWYDYWLKGIETGILDEPPVKVFVMGANRWRYAQDWPLPETKWTKYYLDSWERLRTEEFTPRSRDGYSAPDAFVQMPPTQTRTIQKLRYMTEPLTEDTLVIGPSALYLHAEIDQPDTNWIAILKDVGPDESIRSARPGEMYTPEHLPEREISRGWLKATHKALDLDRSKPWKPWHPMTRESQQAIKPGEVNEYVIEMMSTANLFRRGHRICLEITSMDLPTGVGGNTNVEYIPYHVCSSRTTLHKVHRNGDYPSHLLLPIVQPDDFKLTQGIHNEVD